MPHVPLPGGVEIYYEAIVPPFEQSAPTSSSPDGPTSPPASSRTDDVPAVGSVSVHRLELNPNVPTLVFLTPIWLDSSYCTPIIEHFRDRFNIITFECRSHGRARGPVEASVDFFVIAADVAFAMETLRIPPSHVFGSGALAFQIGLKLCLLFPNQVLTLALAGAGQLFAPPEHVQVFEELDHAWFFAEDEGDFYETMEAIAEIFLSDDSSDDNPERVDLRDRVLGTFIRRYSPYNLTRALEVTRANHRHPCVSPADFAQVHQPVMLLHGTADKCYRHQTVRREVPQALTNAKEVDWQVIDDAPHLLILTHAQLVNEHWSLFLARYPDFSSEPVPLDRPHALKVAATLTRHTNGELKPEHISKRSGDDPRHFSLVTPAEQKSTEEDIARFERYAKECRLNLPGRSTLDPWEAPSTPLQEPGQQWAFSRRHLFDDRVPGRHPVLSDISVSILADEFDSRMSPSNAIDPSHGKSFNDESTRTSTASTTPPKESAKKGKVISTGPSPLRQSSAA